MASIAQSLPVSNSPLAWLWEWVRDELSPYPGRALLVGRMVLSATLIMIIGMTFQIPYTWQGAIYALLVSRESPRATITSAATIFLITGIGVGYIILSMKLVINILPLHFLWIVATFFSAFYGISTLTNYLAAVAFVNTIALGIPLWDRRVSAETNVEDTLWLCLAVLIAVVVTGAVELAYSRQRPGDEILSPMTERLSAVEDVLSCYAEGRAPEPASQRRILRLATLGTSTMRRRLRRANVPPQYSAAAGGVVVLIGRLVDLAATLTPLSFESSADNRSRFHSLASTLAGIRNDLMNRKIPARVQFNAEADSAAVAPLLGEMERTVALMSEVFAGTQAAHEYLSSPDQPERPTLLSRDAFTNPAHLLFALKGCLAASLCYVIYKALAWPGISTAVTTCLLTALSTIGSSRQKQILRIAGAIAGGFVIGMGAQIFILPYLDSIAGFLVLFVIVTAVSAWFMTSSPRLSYFGVQLALAFYLIHLQEFTIQTSLSIARDRVVGILLGLFMMWLVFDQLWGVRAAVEMRRTFLLNLRLVAQFARGPASTDLKSELGRSRVLRETINANLDKVRAVADGVFFELGPSRRRDLELRSYIRQVQPQLRTLFVMRIAFLKYRLQLPGFELPESVRLRQQVYDEVSAGLLEQTADRIDDQAPEIGSSDEQRQELLKRTLGDVEAEASRELPAAQAQSFLTLLREIDALTNCLAAEIATKFTGSA
ncbi:MAG TPA: FUSC family protein [Bryobacteraceae bacterium]|nr:FUSC family protein [Bryobacteraceae bacterium]